MATPRKYVLPLFFLMLLAGTAVLGPLLYFGMGWVYPIPFHRAMDRALLISAVAGGLFWSWSSLRHWWPLRGGEAARRLLYGYLMAAVTVQGMIGLNLALSGFTFASLTGGQIAGRLLLSLVAALLIPFLEETIFRGFLQGECAKNFGWRWGWITAAFIFMLAHFLKIPVELDKEPVRAWSGLTVLGEAFRPLVRGDFLCGRGLNLFLAGLILGGIFLRSGSLWLNAGLHSGWIFALLFFTGVTRPLEHPQVSLFAGDILSSLSTTVVFILFGIWLWHYYHPPSGAPAAGASAR